MKLPLPTFVRPTRRTQFQPVCRSGAGVFPARILALAGVFFLLLAWAMSPVQVHGAPNPASATEAIAAFDTGNKHYEQGKFSEAAQAYQQIVQNGQRSVALFFNLGNAWFKAGQFGRAIAAYRQAERLSPRDPNVRFNLAFARKQVTVGEPASAPLLERMLRGLTLDEWTWLTAACFWITLTFLIVGELRASFRSTGRRYAFAAALATLLFGAATTVFARRSLYTQDGVIAVPNAIVRAGPLEDAKTLHQFRDGTEVRIVDRKQLSVGVGDAIQFWFHVRNQAGETGWVKDDQVVLIR
jgi:hypothetical protein